MTNNEADICLVLEGTYPFVRGGVSNWAHELIQAQSDLTFHLLAIVAPSAELEMKYDLPVNVNGVTIVTLQELDEGSVINVASNKKLHQELKEPLAHIMSEQSMTVEVFSHLISILKSEHGELGMNNLLNCEEAWEQMVMLYESSYNEQSFLDYFWSYRALASGIYSILLADLPKAKLYHAMSTGYAGLYAARAKVETGRPALLTEHGIYTNERRVEVISADWLQETASKSLTIDKTRRDLRDMWIDTIFNFSKICYDTADNIITLYEGNQKAQREDGADPDKMRIIPNGIDIHRYGSIAAQRQAIPTIGLIGRVVPIKDIKSFIRTCHILRNQIPELRAYVMGPTDEDEQYYQECLEMVRLLALEDTVSFTGQVRVDDYLPQIDVMVLTSLSEAQPLVVLEAGACGIPVVATDVGACRELIEGNSLETPALGHGGVVCPLANPAAIAEGVYRLLADESFYQECSDTMRARMAQYYNRDDLHNAYKTLYAHYMAA